MTWHKTTLLLLTLVLFAAGLVLSACDDGCDGEECDCNCDDDAVDDDDAAADDDDNSYNSCDTNQECLDWYNSCWGADQATFAQDFCNTYMTLFDQYWDSTNPCVKNAQCEFFGCLQVNVTDCLGTDPTALQGEIDACWMVYEATANACP
ncbi:MAG: hypothetical protein P9L99_12935 [Candidatus Lernaella stagnicola]|nr:hypothetical protein [Candidatus Lernaella stagnicola]